MPIVLTCSCGKRLQARDDLAGKKIRCPACSRALLVGPVRKVKQAAAVGAGRVEQRRSAPGQPMPSAAKPASSARKQARPVVAVKAEEQITEHVEATQRPASVQTFLEQRSTPWRPGDRERFQAGPIDDEAASGRLIFLLAALLAGGAAAAWLLWP